MAASPAQFQAAADKIVQLAPLEEQFVHGSEHTDVPTENGPVPAMAKIARLARDATDVAVKAINMFATTAEGLANTQDGDFFDLPSAASTGFSDRWQNVGGVAVDTGKSFPALGYVESIDDRTQGIENRTLDQVPAAAADDEVQWSVTDRGGKVALGVAVSAAGKARVVGVIEQQINDAATGWKSVPVPMPSAAMSEKYKDAAVLVVDEGGRVLSVYNKDGKQVGPGAAGEPEPPPAASKSQPYVPAAAGDVQDRPVVYVRLTPARTAFAMDGAGVERQVTFNGDVFGVELVEIATGHAIKYATGAGIVGRLQQWLSHVDGTMAIPSAKNVLMQILCTGQSLSIGPVAGISMQPRFPEHSLTLSCGTNFGAGVYLPSMAITSADMVGFQPAIAEQLDSPGVTRSAETIAHGLMDGLNSAIDDVLGFALRMVYTGHGRDATPYSGIKKGTIPYANGIAMVQRCRELANELGWDHFAKILAVVHGESDSSAKPALGVYASYLAQMYRDYHADIAAVTGDAAPLQMFLCQYSSWTRAITSSTSNVPLDQLAAAVLNPNVHLVTPKYMLSYHDGVHPFAPDMFHLGEYYSKAIRRVLARGRWDPVRPTKITRTGRNIDVEFKVPVGNLVLDTSLVSNPGHHGFEYFDSLNSTVIESESVIDTNRVRIVLASAPSAVSIKRLAYAYTGEPGNYGGPTTGARGCLRDTDPYKSILDDASLHNYCVTFNEAIN